GQVLVIGQHFHAVEAGLAGDAVDFFQALVDFVLDGSQVGIAVGAVLCLYGQFADTLQVVVDLVQRAFRSLRHGNAVVGVALCLRQAGDLRAHAVGDGLAGGIVGSAVD